MMISLLNILKTNRDAIVLPNHKPDGIRSGIIRGKSFALAARVTELADREYVLFRLKTVTGNGPADPCPKISQREHGRTGLGISRACVQRVEIGTGHRSGGIVTRMATNRLEMLKKMVAENPQDSFLRYGLAMEHRNGGDLESAMAEFQTLLAANPDYVPAYFHGGQTLERMARTDEAREFYRNGIEASVRTGDAHARSELEAALGMLE